MAASTPNTILLEVNGAERPIFEKAAVSAVVVPGDLLAPSAASVTPHATGGGTTQKMFAVENPYAEDPSTPAIDQHYDVADFVRYIYAQPGDLVYARLATSQVATVGHALIASGTAGLLAITTVDASTFEGALVGYAEEAVTTSNAILRIKVRIA